MKSTTENLIEETAGPFPADCHVITPPIGPLPLCDIGPDFVRRSLDAAMQGAAEEVRQKMAEKPLTQGLAQAALIALDPDRCWTVEYGMSYRPGLNGPINEQAFRAFCHAGFDGTQTQMFVADSWEQIVENAQTAHRKWTENKALDEQYADVDRAQSLDRQFGLVRD